MPFHVYPGVLEPPPRNGESYDLRPPGDDGDGDLDLEKLKEVLGFFLRAPRRRPLLATTAFCLTLAAGLAVALFWPRTFACEARISAQRNLVLPALDNPTRAIPHEADNPTHNAADSILRRDNIVALVKQLDLLDRWEASRLPLLRFQDKVLALFLPPRTEEERLRDMIELLDKRLLVTSDDSSVTISIQWPNREMAYEIVSFLQSTFLAARYDSNVNVIAEAIRILQARAKPQAAEVDTAFAELTRLEAERAQELQGAGRSGGFSSGRVSRDATPPSSSGEIHRKTARELQDESASLQLDADRRRELSDLRSQLAETTASLGTQHPKVVALKDRIAELSAKRSDSHVQDYGESELLAGLGPSASKPPLDSLTSARPRPRAAVDLRDDSKTARARAHLADVEATSNELLARIDAANIELDVTRAAFKYQYAIVRPAELPRKPIRPNLDLVLIGSTLLALFLAFFLPGVVDWVGGRLIERWQVERRLRLLILGELPPN